MLLLFCAVTLTYAGSCATDRSEAPDQNTVNAIIDRLILESQNLSAQFSGVDNCNEFNNTVGNLEGPGQCAGGGSTTTTITEQPMCSEGPPLMGNFALGVTSDNCTFNGQATKGGFSLNATLDGDTFTSVMSSPDLIVVGVQLMFADFTVVIQAGGALMCSGSFIFNRSSSTCTLSEDCSSCPVMSL